MPSSKIGDFELPSTGGTFRLSEQHGHPVVVYFYPKDNTPGCTLEGQQFRDLYAEFSKSKCVIVGISRDSLKSHASFKSKMSFPFELLSDEDEKVCRQFAVIKMKNMYGKQVQGIERSTFLFDTQGILVREWRKVKVKGHAEEVLQALSAMKSG